MLLYAWGYSFDWQAKKPVLTGGLYLKSIPKKTDVYLNNKLKEETPVFIKRLLPKDYQIKITKSGFHDWYKKLKVESRLVTEAKNILLIPLSPQIKIIRENLTEDFSLEEFFNPEESDSVLYIQQPSYILYRSNSNNLTQEQISSTPLPAQKYQVFASDNQKIAALGNNQKLYLLNPETKTFELISQNIQQVEFSRDNKKLLYATPSEIWVYYLEDILEQPNKKAGDKELITRLSQKIKQVLWYKTNEHIVFSVGQNIKIIELDGRDQRNIFDVIQANTEQMIFNPKDDKLYFVEQEKLSAISLEE
tara:strand:- start:3493 stop:4410 length:918 start_codon:yes stop_codon:yes gene_type:complete